MPGNFENTTLFLTQGLPSTLRIRHENGAFRKRSSNLKVLKATDLHFSMDGQQFENGILRKRWRHVISVTESSTDINPK